MSKRINPEIFRCPECYNENLKITELKLECTICNSRYDYIDNKAYFKFYQEKDITDGLDRIKTIIKKYSRLYQLLIKIISPVYPSSPLKKFIKENTGSGKETINFGSGNSDISLSVSNVDIFQYGNIDMTCDITNIPIKDNQLDNIINIAVLEHVPEPEKVVNEFYRILKPGGKIFIFFPFIQGFHASPFDYSRRTLEGVKYLLKDFSIEKIKTGGPTSGFLWVFQEWLALVLSFGSKKMYVPVYLIIMILTFPVKFIDILLQYHPKAENIATGFTAIGRKNK